MAAAKRASFEEVEILHGQMLNLVELDKKLDMEMIKVVSDRANWDQYWQSQYDELIKHLEKHDLFDDEELEEEYSSLSFEEEDKERIVRSHRSEYLEKFLDVESKRHEILNQQATLSAQLKDLLEAELNSEEVLDPNQEPKRRAMIAAMARWWDCLMYNMSEELNERMQDEEPGKWSKLYLKWCRWIDLKAGVFHDENGVQANHMSS